MCHVTLNFIEHLDWYPSPSSEMKLKSIINKILNKLFFLIVFNMEILFLFFFGFKHVFLIYFDSTNKPDWSGSDKN